MATNLDVLTEKIYREGVEKAQEEAEEILEKARDRSKQIVKEAEEKAARILKEAEKDAGDLRKNTLADIKLAGNRAISSLKQEIKSLVNRKIITGPAKELFHDPAFLKSLILEVVKADKDKGTYEIKLPAKLRDKIDDSFKNSLQNEIKDLTITFDDKLSGGFRLRKDGEDFSLTFTDEDFAEYFKSFLREKTEEILFRNDT